MVFAIIAAAVMSPDIEHARWLNQEEKVALRTAFNSSGRGGETEGTFSWSEVASALTSPFTLLLLPAFMANGLVVFGTAYLCVRLFQLGRFADRSFAANLRSCALLAIPRSELNSTPSLPTPSSSVVRLSSSLRSDVT